MAKSRKSNRRMTPEKRGLPRKLQKNSRTGKKSEKTPRKASANGNSTKSLNEFPIVGIGASAGGLEAIKELLYALPADTGMAFVFILHLEPTRKSMAPEILSRATRMSVLEVKDGMRVEPNHVYMIPSNCDLALLNGVLSLPPRHGETRGPHMVIDTFFRSLAHDHKRRAIGVVLSGTANDGTQGLIAIKSEGGLAIAEDPNSAKFSGMPESAIASGSVDFVLSPKEIAGELARISKHPYLARSCGDEATQTPSASNDNNESKDIESGPDEAFHKIFAMLHTQMKVDFSNYKQSTIKRRIQRRMIVRKCENVEAYAKYLKGNPNEVKDLHGDILIHVTEFFRDPDCFKALQSQVFPKLLKNSTADLPIRVWVPGCSTGEEAYSLAILLLEYLSNAGFRRPIQIFATDISEDAIQKARKGVYPQSIESAVSKERLELFFEKVKDGYKIKKSIRDLCLFSKHDVTRDPPFSKLNLVSCRNVLIYFADVLQNRVIPIFHYSLNPDGILFLGKAESPGAFSKLFSLVNKTHKIFAKVNIPTPLILRTPVIANQPDVESTNQKSFQQPKSGAAFQREAERIAASRYVPPFVVINEDMDILQFHGRTVPYLEPASGLTSNNLFKMARQELLHDLRLTIGSVTKENAVARKEGLSFDVDGNRKTVNIEVVLGNPSALPGERNFLIFFEEVASLLLPKLAKGSTGIERGLKKGQKAALDKQGQRIIRLEKDLSASKDLQRSLAQEHETTQEELTSANEELQSANEELQSTNEELETSKEELESSNEELSTVNDELQSRNADLLILSSDLDNVMNNVEIPIVLVGGDHRIRRFSPKAENVFNLIPGDVGRPIADFKLAFEVELDAMILNAIKTLSPQEREVHVDKSRWIRVQVRPYRTVDDRVNGAIIALVDITALKEHLSESQTALKYATSVADTLALPLVVLDENLHLLSANQGFIKMFEIVPHKDIGTDLMSVLGGKGWSILPLRKLLSDVMTEDQELVNFEVEHDFPELGHRIMLLNARQIKWQNSVQKALLLSIDDITERKSLERDILRAKEDAEHANATKDVFLATLSHELRTPLSAILSWAQLIQREKFAPEKLKHGIETIEQSAKTQGQLIDDLLDVARIQSGKLSTNFADIDACEPVRSAVDTVRAFAAKKHIVFEIELKLESEIVWGDSERLQQIVWNLLTNAIKFSANGGTVQVRVEPVEEECHKFVSIKVIDTGKGIKSDFLPKLFEHFSQADSGSIRTHGGLGLGLAIVHELTRMHGGTVRAESDGLGKGSTFTVLLPVKSGEPERTGEAGASAKKRIGAETERPNLFGLCVMIIEDEPRTLEVLSEALVSFGAKTVLCASVAEALTAFEKSKPTILVSDIAMPGEDGYSLIRKIRELGPKKNGDIPSLALTAYATERDVKRALSAGFDSHMAKPFDTFRLGHVVAELAKKKFVDHERENSKK